MSDMGYLPISDVINLTAIDLSIYFNGVSATSDTFFVLPSRGALNLKPSSTPSSQWPPAGVSSAPIPNYSDGQPRSIPIIPGQKFESLDESSPGYKQFCDLLAHSHVIVTLPVAQFITAKKDNFKLPGPIYLYTSGGSPAMTVRSKDGKPIGTKSLEFYGVIGRPLELQ